jgi:hypothetical protein
MAISLQSLAVSQNRRKKRGPRLAELRSMYGKATQDVMARKEVDRMRRDEEFQRTSQAQSYQLGSERNALTRMQMRNQERMGQMGMGIQFANLGLQAGRGLTGKSFSVPGASGIDIDLGAGLGGGLLGMGLGQVLGGRDKWKRALIGAGTGALSSYLFSPGADFISSLGDIGAGGFLGLLGGFI